MRRAGERTFCFLNRELQATQRVPLAGDMAVPIRNNDVPTEIACLLWYVGDSDPKNLQLAIAM